MMQKERGRQVTMGFEPPGKWSHEATLDFYERHDGDVKSMIETIKNWDFIYDAGGFAAKIADYCLGTTAWRGRMRAMDEEERRRMLDAQKQQVLDREANA